MKKSILILFVLLSHVCIGQNYYPNYNGIALTPDTSPVISLGSLLESQYRNEDMYLFSTQDSISSSEPYKIITIHAEYEELNNKKKAETIAKMEAWILSEKKKLKK